jgi:hypothetical protein
MRIARYAVVFGLTALAAACSSSNDTGSGLTPSTPTTVLTANADGSILKVSAPTPIAPANNATLAQGVTAVQLQTTAASGQFIGAALTHRFELYRGSTVSGSPLATFLATPSGTTASVTTGTLDALTAYTWRVRGESTAGAGPWSSAQTFTTGGQPRRDARTFGGQVPRSLVLADLKSQLSNVANAHPTELLASCKNGRNAIDFPKVLLDALRQIDNRWGFNCRRGNCSDPSNDVVAYHWSPGSSEQSTNVYLFDVIGGLDAVSGCAAQIIDVTDITYGSGSLGRYSLLGRFLPNNPDF